MRSFFLGLKSPWVGWSMLKKHPSLKIRLVIPYTIIAAVLGVLIYLFALEGVTFIQSLVEMILESVRLDPDGLSQMKWYTKILFYPLFYLLKTIFYLISAALVMLTTLIFGNVLCAFFWELLIEEVFILEGKKAWVFENESLFQKVFTPLVRELIKELIYVLVFVVVWFVTIMPFIGPMISLVLGPIAICFWFGFIVSDFSMSVMASKVKDRMDYGKKHWLYLTGVGVYALIPVLGLLMYPLFIIGHAKNMATSDLLTPPDHLLSQKNHSEERAETDI